MASKLEELGDEYKSKLSDDLTFKKFAEKHFQSESSHYSSGDVLKRPLLPLKDRKHQQMALKIWVVLLRLMVWLHEPKYLDLMKKYDATPIPSLIKYPPRSDLEMSQYIIWCGIDEPDLRDEIFCQLCKQLTKNSDNQSYLKVWDLLCLCVGCFPPSENLVNYLRNFIKGGPSDYASYCEERLQRTIKKGLRVNPPCFSEVQATKSKKPLKLSVMFSDGNTMMVSVDSFTTARDLCLHIAEQISLVDQFGFLLNLQYCNQVVRLDSGRYVMDVISYMELQAASRNKSPDVTSCYLVFRKEIFAPWQILSDDPVATNLIYFQVVDRVKSGQLGYDKDEDLVRMTTKQNVNDPKVKEDIVRYVRNKLALSFSLFWPVDKVAGPGLQKDTAFIVVNSTDLYVVDGKTDSNKWNGKYFIKLSFPEILYILSNRTDDMPWFAVIVTIQTVKGDQYTYTTWSVEAEEIKYIVEAIQTPPSKQDHSQAGPTDSDDVNIAGMSRMKITAGDVIQGGEVAGELDINKGAVAGVVDDINRPVGELDANKGAVAGVVDDLNRPAGELDVNKGAVAGVVDDLNRPAGELDVNKGAVAGVVDGEIDVNKRAVAGVVDDLNRPAGELDVNKGAVAGVVDDLNRPAGELDVNKGAVAGVVDDLNRPAGELDVNKGAVAGVVDDLNRPAGELDANKGVVAGVVDDLNRPAGKLDANKGAVAGVVDDLNRPAGELDANKGAVAAVFDDLNRPAGKLDINEGAVAGVVDDINGPAGELDVNKGAVAGVVDDLNRPAGELDANKGVVAGVVDDLNRPAGELDAIKGVVAGVVDDLNRPSGELDVNKGAVAGVVDDINRPAGELDVNEGAVAGVVDDINGPAGELDVNKGAVAGVAVDISRPPGELDINEGAVAGAAWDMSENVTPITIIKNYTLSGNVENITTAPSQTINSAIENLYNRTDTELDDELLFDVTDSNAFKSIKDVLHEYSVAFIVGSSPILKKTIGLSSLRRYREQKETVLSLSSVDDNDIAAIMDGCEKFVFLHEVFGHTNLNENRFDKVFDILKKSDQNNRLFFTLTPLAFNSCQNRLKALLPKLKYMIIDLDSREEFDVDTKSKILFNIKSRVEENPERRGILESEIDDLSQEDNPVYLECCLEYLTFRRFDEDICQLFLQPMDCLIKELLCLKEEWQEGFQCLVLVALCPEFGFSVKNVPKVMTNYMELIHEDFELRDIKKMCKMLTNSYLQKENTQFRYEMYRNAILSTVENKDFLLTNCPLTYITDVAAMFVNQSFYRNPCISVDHELSALARRIISECRNGNVSKLAEHKIWNSALFMEIFNRESGNYFRQVLESRDTSHTDNRRRSRFPFCCCSKSYNNDDTDRLL